MPELNESLVVLVVFIAVYLGMIAGGLPFLQIGGGTRAPGCR